MKKILFLILMAFCGLLLFLLGSYIGSQKAAYQDKVHQLTHNCDSLKRIVDSTDGDNLMLKIQVGRYEYMFDLVKTEDSVTYEKFMKAIEGKVE